jgi:hypothetical protein
MKVVLLACADKFIKFSTVIMNAYVLTKGKEDIFKD